MEGRLRPNGTPFITLFSYEMTYRFVNYGRTPAILLEAEDRLEICKLGRLPTPYTQGQSGTKYPYGVLIGPDKESVLYERHLLDFFHDDMIDILRMGLGEETIFLIGFLRYRDIFDATYEIGFCAGFNAELDRLMEGAEKYNYLRKIA